ncbi:hypothetical protein N7490_010357 [Penicillium lividum]|nr:hypothetical protein N7490_010357 [Penicillium lividum]
MRFLCLHGKGTNARIFKQQTAALRYELGEGHSYDFVDGPHVWEMDPDLDEFVMGEEKTFAICDPASPSSCLEAMENIERYIAAEGPFDGIMTFSQGTSIALGWLIKRQLEAKGGEPWPLPFKIAYMYSPTFEGLLDFPTAHIWGSADKDQAMAEMLSNACVADKRSVFVHTRGHEIPADINTVISMAKTINRAIVRAESME